MFLFVNIEIELTVSEVYDKLKEMKSSNLKGNKKATQNLTLKLSLHMSLEYISSKNPQLYDALKCLSLCPSGLRKKDLVNLVPEWDDWVELLKDRSLIREKHFSDVSPNQQNSVIER